MGTRRRSFGACVVMGELYVIGERNELRDVLSSVETYLPSSDTWCTVSSLHEARSDHAAVALGSTLYVLGGFAGVDPTFGVTASVLRLDTLQGIWSAVAPMPEPRFYAAACVVGSDISYSGVRMVPVVTKDQSLGMTRRPTNGQRWRPCLASRLGTPQLSSVG
jgi:hypothetical protein